MALRYRRGFKSGLFVVALCFLLFGALVTLAIVSWAQYASLTEGMVQTEATVTHVSHKHHVKGPQEQEIDVAYEVDGVRYERELESDTAISFGAGVGAHYRVGDSVAILYDPENPAVIAVPRSVGVGIFYFAVSFVGLAFMTLVLFLVIKRRKTYLVTEEEYEREERARQRHKEQQKKEKQKKKQERAAKHPLARRVLRVLIILAATAVLGFALFLLLGMLLSASGYGGA